MGMTDRQFDAYQKSLLRDLKKIKKEILAQKEDMKTEVLDELTKDIEDSLQRP